MPTPRRPDYTLSIMDRDTGKKLPNAGGAWKNPDGSLSLSLNTCVVITGDRNLAIALFPASNSSSLPRDGVPLPPHKPAKKQSTLLDEHEGAFNTEDEIPF